MIEFQQTLSDKEYRKALLYHYLGYKYTYITPILGYIILLLIIILTVFFPGSFDINTILLLFLSFYLIIRPYLYIRRWLKNMKTSKIYSDITNYQILDDDKLIVTSKDNSSTTNLKDLFASYDKGRFLFLYITRNQFFILDKKEMNPKQIEYLNKRLADLNIKNI